MGFKYNIEVAKTIDHSMHADISIYGHLGCDARSEDEINWLPKSHRSDLQELSLSQISV